MERPRQFTLAYLFLEVFWVAAALGASRLFLANYQPSWLLFLSAAVSYGIAIGGLFRKMKEGAAISAVIAAVILAMSAAVMGTIRE